MSCLWISLSLLFVLHHSVLSDQVVKLMCPQTVEVNVENTMINCSIKSTKPDCQGISFSWKNKTGTDLCKNNNYMCKWDNKTYVLLTIVKATTEETVTADVVMGCGMGESTTVKVYSATAKTSGDLRNGTPGTAIMLGVVIIILGYFIFLV